MTSSGTVVSRRQYRHTSRALPKVTARYAEHRLVLEVDLVLGHAKSLPDVLELVVAQLHRASPPTYCGRSAMTRPGMSMRYWKDCPCAELSVFCADMRQATLRSRDRKGNLPLGVEVPSANRLPPRRRRCGTALQDVVLPAHEPGCCFPAASRPRLPAAAAEPTTARTVWGPGRCPRRRGGRRPSRCSSSRRRPGGVRSGCPRPGAQPRRPPARLHGVRASAEQFVHVVPHPSHRHEAPHASRRSTRGPTPRRVPRSR